MIKEYLKIQNEEDETQRIEQFWTQHWNEKVILPDEKIVAFAKGSEEFPILDSVLKQLPKNALILDGGCGTAEWTRYCSLQGFRTIGLDLSQETVDRLQKAFPTLEFQVGDIRNLNFADNSVDLYFSWGTFEHFEEGFARCFQEALRVLKPGGHLIISVPFHNWRHWFRDKWGKGAVLIQSPSEGAMAFYQYRLTVNEMKAQMILHGFQPSVIKGIGKAQGAQRMASQDLKLKQGSFLFKAVWNILARVLPGGFLSHMVIGHAKKPG